MALLRICDRCTAAAPLAWTPAASTKAIVVPPGDLATLKVAADLNVSIGIAAGQDLCPICAGSTVLEYLLAQLGPATLRAVVVAFTARLKAAGA